MRGFIGGLAIGLVTVALAIVGLSLLSPANRPPAVSDGAPQSAAEPTGTGTGDASDVTAPGPDADLVELPPTAPENQGDDHDNLDPLEIADTDPGDKPTVGDSAEGLADQGEVPQAAGVDVAGDAPIAPTSPSEAPGAPQGDTDPNVVTTPAQPVSPDVSQDGSGFATAPTADETAPEIATPTDPTPPSTGGETVATAPVTESAPTPSTDSAAAPEQAQPKAPEATAPAADTAPASETAPVETAPVETDTATDQAPVPEVGQAAPQEPQEPDNSQIAALPQAGAEQDTSGPSIGTPVVPFTQRKKSSEDQTEASDQASEPAALAPSGPPIEVNAEPFENADNRPIMSIVLIDDADGIGAEALVDFPYPLTFAIDPTDPGAAEKMARHREAGFEVLALVDMPTNATAQDAEVNLSVWLDSLPQVVGLLEGPGTGIQGNRELSDHVTAIVADRQLGLVMRSQGLNTAFKLAARENVPAALVFRDFDGAGQTPDVMRRFLDQAAFRAGQQGGVIMLGRLRPDTISALLLWGLQDRASRVALAPVSALLTQ